MRSTATPLFRTFGKLRQSRGLMGRKSLRKAGGFTLVELLVTVGIIALLFGISLVGISVARTRAQRIRTLDDLHMIEVALDQYRDQFQDYPRFPDPTADQATQSNSYNGTWLDYSTDRGARLLCQALIAPGPAGTGQFANPGEDGADGPGFKIRRTIAGGGTTGVISGKTYEALLAPDKFKLESNMANMQDAKILDNNGNPVLYYPALPGPPSVSLPNSFVMSVNPQTFGPAIVKPLYNAFDNTVDTTTNKPLLSVTEMQFLLGDTDNNGMIDSGDLPTMAATTTQRYLLWTAGRDGKFGRDKSGKTDDLANFDFPPGDRK